MRILLSILVFSFLMTLTISANAEYRLAGVCRWSIGDFTDPEGFYCNNDLGRNKSSYLCGSDGRRCRYYIYRDGKDSIRKNVNCFIQVKSGDARKIRRAKRRARRKSRDSYEFLVALDDFKLRRPIYCK